MAENLWMKVHWFSKLRKNWGVMRLHQHNLNENAIKSFVRLFEFSAWSSDGNNHHTRFINNLGVKGTEDLGLVVQRHRKIIEIFAWKKFLHYNAMKMVLGPCIKLKGVKKSSKLHKDEHLPEKAYVIIISYACNRRSQPEVWLFGIQILNIGFWTL